MSVAIPVSLKWAQDDYMRRTGVQISQAEVQRLSGAIAVGMTIADAVQSVWAFFDLHRRAFEYCKQFENGPVAMTAYEHFYSQNATNALDCDERGD